MTNGSFRGFKKTPGFLNILPSNIKIIPMLVTALKEKIKPVKKSRQETWIQIETALFVVSILFIAYQFVLLAANSQVT